MNRLLALRHAVCADASKFDPATLGCVGARRVMAEWAAIVNAAQAACDLAAARVKECDASGAAADEVAKVLGTSIAKAKQRIETGRQLRSHDRTRKAATAGTLSGDQSAMINDAAAANPDAEEQLLATAATKSNAELRDECAKKKAAADPDPEATEKRIHAKRCLRRYIDAEGAAHLHATGTKRDIAKLDVAIRREVDKVFRQKRAEGVREPYEAYAFDALINLAEGNVDAKQPTITNLGLLRLDWEALIRGRTAGDETCEIAGLGPIPVATARQMLGQSILKLVITKGVDVVNVTHLGRGPTAAQKVALVWSQPRCRVVGCGRIGRLQVDHRNDWARCHETVLTNLDHLCTHHHMLKTRDGWELVCGNGEQEMVPPDHPEHPRNRKEQPP